MAGSGYSKVVNLAEESKMGLSLFSGSEDVIESRRCKDFNSSIIPNTVHSVVYCPVTLGSTRSFRVVAYPRHSKMMQNHAFAKISGLAHLPGVDEYEIVQ